VRLWTLHPRYLDAKGIVALWREALLAQAVLRGRTRGYRHHPQLDRFRQSPSPLGAIAAYLREVHAEATRRGYEFDGSKIARAHATPRLPATRGQIDYEWGHLRRKLRERDPSRLARWRVMERPRAHPLFRVGPGPRASWEVAARARRRARRSSARGRVRRA